jgi:hypothetical protein
VGSSHAHCLLRPENEKYPYGYTMSTIEMMGVAIPGKTNLEFEENLEKYNFEILTKWNAEINGEKMHWYLLSNEMSINDWLNFSMQMIYLRNNTEVMW